MNTTRSGTPLTAASYGNTFDVEIQFGNQSFLVLFDTGSSDTWVLQSGWQCINATDNSELARSDCSFGNETYDTSSTFEQIPSEWFGVHYGNGDAVGLLGHEDVTLGGITIERQEVGIVNRSTTPGDGINTGVVGFGYPVLTSAHLNNDTSNSSLLTDRILYDGLFTRMYKAGFIEPYFSLAIERPPVGEVTGAGGYLALGELPPVAHSPAFATVPVEITKAIPLFLTNGTPQITEWTLSVAATTYGGTTNSTAFQALVDVGNPLNYIPATQAAAINQAFRPPAVFDTNTSTYAVACNATPPVVGFKIGNQTFLHNRLDMVVNNGDGTCTSAVAAVYATDGVELNVLGAAFLTSVVAVFDMGNNEMRFAARGNSSTQSVTPHSGGGEPQPQISSGTSNAVLNWGSVGLAGAVLCFAVHL